MDWFPYDKDLRHETVKQHWAWVEKKRYLKKRVLIIFKEQFVSINSCTLGILNECNEFQSSSFANGLIWFYLIHPTQFNGIYGLSLKQRSKIING